MLSEKYTVDRHKILFERLCKLLSGYTEKCVISFVDLYKKTERNTKALKLKPMTENDMLTIAEEFANIGKKYDIKLETCSESIDLSQFGIKKGKCIDDELIEKILGCKVKVNKDKNQRDVCGCAASVDIGQYNTCRHHCAYCYANFNYKTAENNSIFHDVKSPMLIGAPSKDAKITIRDMKSVCVKHEMEQLSYLKTFIEKM